MPGSTIPVTVVNHLAIDIVATPERVWRTILSHFVATDNWEKAGYSVAPVDDPAAALGGYHLRKDHDGAVVDERIVVITEFDETARRLSLFADHSSVPDGLLVYATYGAHEMRGGARFTIDCHARLGIAAPVNRAKADVAAAIDELRNGFDDHLKAYLRQIKDALEKPADRIA